MPIKTRTHRTTSRKGKLIILTTLTLASCAILGVAAKAKHQDIATSSIPELQVDPKTRPFHLGFTLWPSDLSLEGIKTAGDFANQHGDIISVCFIGGIPWPESLSGGAYSRDVQGALAYRPPKGKKLFVQISILDKDRKGMAPYWGAKDNLPLPMPWTSSKFDSPEVKKAYLNFTLRVIEAMHPDYLAIGMENNVLLSNDRGKFQELKLLHAATFLAIKAKYPKLPVFFTTEVMHYKHYAKESVGTDQEAEVAKMMQYSDLFAMSFYPFMSFNMARPIPADFFNFARQFKKPIAVSESGDTSRNVELKSFHLTLKGTEEGQSQFTSTLLKTATKDNYRFVINFATTDFEKLCDRLSPPLDDLARIWSYTGMQDSAKSAKPALAVWDAYLRAKFVPTN